MPINRLSFNKPPVLSTNKATSSTTGGAKFQGRYVTAAKPQSVDFLPAGNAWRTSHIFSSTNQYASIRNITVSRKDKNQVLGVSDYDKTAFYENSHNNNNEEVAPQYQKAVLPAHNYKEMDSSQRYDETQKNIEKKESSKTTNLYSEMRSVINFHEPK